MPVDDLSLAGKVAIITGSGRENGIGAGIAAALARNGAAVTINYVSDSSAERAAAVAKKIQDAGGKATVVRASVDQHGAKVLVEKTLKAFECDHIDILVNNAGTGFMGTSLEMPAEQIQKTIDVNVYGALWMVRAVIPHMPAGGRIINISSVSAKFIAAPVNFYGVSKSTLDYLTVLWAEELGKSRGITVNSLAPGVILTDLQPTEPEVVKNFVDPMVKMTRAADRVGTVEEFADAILLIVSEKARWITAQHISVSGGITGL